MSTNSLVGYEEYGVYHVVYVHYDGSTVGDVLSSFHNSLEAAKQIVSLGSASFLSDRIEPSVGSGHSFETPEKGVSVFYHRDREEGFQPAVSFIGLSQVVNEEYSNIEFLHLFINGSWVKLPV